MPAPGPLSFIRTGASRPIFRLVLNSCGALAWFVTISSVSYAAVFSAEEGGRASKPHVGSAMALLATLAQAHVLPPENTPEATKVVQSVIQFQSAFAKSRDTAVRSFATEALSAKYGGHAGTRMAEFQARGWTAAFLEALAEAEERATPAERLGLAPGFEAFNLSVEDFHRLMELIRGARHAFAARGLAFEEVYASHRRTMPGATKDAASPESSEPL